MSYNYDKDVDYSLLIKEAAAKGDFEAAARYEQARNAKIQGEGLNYATTDQYSQYLKGSGKEYGLNPVLPSFDLNSYGSRPVFDETSFGARPTYDNRYAEQIDALLQQILNREKFSYDAESDPLFQQYKATYNREGTRAMNDTLAAAASGAGGMSSYAMTAAQQANDYYAAKLGDKIPELYQLAYSMYLDDLNNQRSDLGMLQNAEQLDYGKYLDSLGQWNTDRSFAYGQYRDQVGDWENDRNFGYQKYRDDMGDYQWGTEFNYNAERDRIEDERYEREWAYRYQGGNPAGDPGDDPKHYPWIDVDLTAVEKELSGLDPNVYDLEGLAADAMASEDPVAFIRQNAETYRYSRNGGWIGGNQKPADNPKNGDTGAPAYDYWGMQVDAAANGGDADAWIRQYGDIYSYDRNKGQETMRREIRTLGLASEDMSTINEIISQGGIVEVNGRLQWASGWNQNNWRSKLRGHGGTLN